MRAGERGYQRNVILRVVSACSSQKAGYIYRRSTQNNSSVARQAPSAAHFLGTQSAALLAVASLTRCFDLLDGIWCKSTPLYNRAKF
jgi:hypothetical protein